MKAIKLFIFVLAVSMAIASCSKDDEVSNSVSGNKYETTYVKMEVIIGGEVFISEEYTTKAELQEQDMYSVAEFKTDGTFYLDGVQDGTWSQNGDTITFTSEGEGPQTATVNGNVITVKIVETDTSGSVNIEMRLTKI